MTGGISLSGAPAGRWTLVHDGRRLEIETGRSGWNRFARLFADGDPAGEASTDWLTVTLPYGEGSVAVVFDALGFVDGQAARCELSPPSPAGTGAQGTGTDEGTAAGQDTEAGNGGEAAEGGEPEKVAFEPAEGTRAARREALARAHPTLYASRHVAAAVGRVVFPLLGLGVLVRVLLRWIPRPDVPFPDVDAPSVPWPDVSWPDLPDLPDVSAPPWLAVVLATAKFWAPILIAAGVTAREARRRKRAAAARGDDPPAAAPPDRRPSGDRRPSPGGRGAGGG
ncbi:hypothetical protein [Actinomadura sp. 9N215]|uniref:hypothetical protein n=1 Tax=Actinomadura sp. 9N215 TaxID=3375150 RepID=UPI0037B8D0D4